MPIVTEAILDIPVMSIPVWVSKAARRHSKGKSKTEGPHSKSVAQVDLFADAILPRVSWQFLPEETDEL